MKFLVLFVMVVSAFSSPVHVHKKHGRENVKNVVQKVNDVPSDDLVDIFVSSEFDDLAEMVGEELGANDDFAEKLMTILRNSTLSRKEIEVELDDLINEQPEEAKSTLSEFKATVLDRVDQIRKRLEKIVEEIPLLAKDIVGVLDDSSLTISESFTKVAEIEKKYDVGTVRAFKTVLATTALTVLQDNDDIFGAMLSVGFMH